MSTKRNGRQIDPFKNMWVMVGDTVTYKGRTFLFEEERHFSSRKSLLRYLKKEFVGQIAAERFAGVDPR